LPPTDVFESANAYERYVGRWSRLAAGDFLRWLQPSPGLRWLDVGCGSGAFTATLLTKVAPDSVVGIDPSPQFIEHARATSNDPRASFSVGNAMKLEFDDAAFDAAAAAIALNFVPVPQTWAQEMMRVVKPGGVVAAYARQTRAAMATTRTSAPTRKRRPGLAPFGGRGSRTTPRVGREVKTTAGEAEK
jgi:ubiquinone/menaquinone biosynthesis C-methylase UbiE